MKPGYSSAVPSLKANASCTFLPTHSCTQPTNQKHPMGAMEEECLTLFPADFSDLEHSFTSTTSSSYATTFTSSSARSSLSLSLPSFSASSTLKPLPHARSDAHWPAVRAAANLSRDGSLHLRNLKLLRHLGSGNLARVFHCRLRGFDDEATGADFALKVVDLDVAARAGDEGSKLVHVRTEARVLAALDHPFLPTLYARLDASHYACFLIDYCPGGDLHTLLRRAPCHRLPVPTARFYTAEVLLALEYLHALGFIYRDLKPENVLLRADGHVMLSDFDLCFQSDVAPTLFKRKKRNKCHRRYRYACCFGATTEESEQEAEEVDFVAEPNSAYSRACVGTHEYLAPEVVSGSGHGNGVDWWAFGVFMYELIYGRTPFKGGTKEATLRNIATRELRFPDTGPVGKDEALARDLIQRLLVRDPKRRLGSIMGAAEIKRHLFFQGVKWPLIRSRKPPVVAGAASGAKEEGKRWWPWKRSTNNSGIIDKMWVRLGLEYSKKTKKYTKEK